MERKGIMYEEKACFDPNSMAKDEKPDTDHFSNLPPSQQVMGSTEEEEEFFQYDPIQADASAIAFQLQQHLPFANEINTTHLNRIYDQSYSNWDQQIQMGFVNQDHQQLPPDDYYNQSSIVPTHDHLNLFHYLQPNSSVPFSYPMGETGSSYDPLLHLQPSLLYQSLPHEQSDYQDFDGGMYCVRKGKRVAGTKPITNERQRRQILNDKYTVLRNLVPKPTKPDKASVVGDVIVYIRELVRTVNELKLLVEKKTCIRKRIKRHKTDVDVEKLLVVGGGDPDKSLRTSCLQRKLKDAEVDVRIIGDDVTIKLVHRKINCLLVSKVLDELHLDLHHLAGGQIGDYCSLWFNTKICEGSSATANVVANRIIEIVEEDSAVIPSANSCLTTLF